MTRQEANRLLQQWTLRAFLQRRPPATVVLLHDDMSLVEVLARFARSNIISAPVFNREELQYLGFLDLLDVVHALLAWFPPHSDPASLATYIEQAGQRLATATVADIALHNDAKLVFQANVNANLLEVVHHGILMSAAAGRPCHRLAVFDYDPTTADPGDAAAGVHFTNIVSQSDVVSFMHQHAAQLGPALLGTSLEGLGLRPRSVVSVPSDMPAIHAFRAVRDSGVGCAGVVELHSHGALVASLSTSDLRGMLPHHIQLLQLPVVEFLSRSLGGWEPSPTTLTQSFGVKSPRKHTREVQVATCSMQTTLGEVLERVAAQHLHRLFVVDESGRPLTVLTLTDLLQLMVGQDGMD